MYLLDTNVLSEIRKVKHGRADARVARWARKLDAKQNYISVISVLELATGAALLDRREPIQGAMLWRWIENIERTEFKDRILPVDLPVARRCAMLHVPDPKAELDTLIAATALVHGMTVVTRNISDFAATGVKLLDPWEA